MNKIHLKWVVSVDARANDNANANIVLNINDSLVDQENKIVSSLEPLLEKENKLDAILNVAGGWAGGNASSAQFLSNSQLMWSQSVCSSLITASLASKFLSTNGVLTLTGAAAAIDSAPTPGMIGYGLAKAAVHQVKI
jgi:dihydropteridine reductase